MSDPNNSGELLLEIRDMMKRLAPLTQTGNHVELDEQPIIIGDASQILKKSKNTIYGYISEAKKIMKQNPDAAVFPFHKKSHKGLYFFRSELIDWVKKQGK